MRIVGIVLGAISLLAVALLLLYSLPSRDIVRIVGTDVKRMDVGSRAWFWAEPDAATRDIGTRDVRFINAAFPDDEPHVYRNEDTGWSYPPYLKFDSGTLTAEAQTLVSTAADPIWVVVTHYGWRIEMFTMYPNVVHLRRAEGPDELLIPWFNIVFLAALVALVLIIRRGILRLRERHLDPVLEDVGERLGDVGAAAQSATTAAGNLRARWRRWLDTWKPKHKRRRL